MGTSTGTEEEEEKEEEDDESSEEVSAAAAAEETEEGEEAVVGLVGLEASFCSDFASLGTGDNRGAGEFS